MVMGRDLLIFRLTNEDAAPSETLDRLYHRIQFLKILAVRMAGRQRMKL
jgi:hypothetical protein